MSDESLTEDELKVLAVIRANPGFTAGALEWAYLGGQFKNGVAVPTNLGVVDPKVFVKAKKAGSRASKLAAGQSVLKRKGAVATLASSYDLGYWPVVGSVRVSAPVGRPVAVKAGESVEVSAGVAKSFIAGLDEDLKL